MKETNALETNQNCNNAPTNESAITFDSSSSGSLSESQKTVFGAAEINEYMTDVIEPKGAENSSIKAVNMHCQQQQREKQVASPLQKESEQKCTEDSFPHISATHRRIRSALGWFGESNFEQKVLNAFDEYITGCRDEFDDAVTNVLKCRQLTANIFRTMDLMHSLSVDFSDSQSYVHRASELIAIYISYELSYARKLYMQKPLITNRISYLIHKHLVVPDENETKANILRMFVYIPRTFKEREVMTKIFQEFVSTAKDNIQQELPDKVFIQYIVVFYQWKQLEDSEWKNRLIDFADNFMRPAVTLCTNASYAKYLPKYSSLYTATKYILTNLKDRQLQYLRFASIYDNCHTSITEESELYAPDRTERLEEWEYFADTYTKTEIEPPLILKPGKSNLSPIPTTIDLTADLEDSDEMVKYNEISYVLELQQNAFKGPPLCQSIKKLGFDDKDHIVPGIETIVLDSETNDEPELFSLDFENIEHEDSSSTPISSRFDTNLRTYGSPREKFPSTRAENTSTSSIISTSNLTSNNCSQCSAHKLNCSGASRLKLSDEFMQSTTKDWAQTKQKNIPTACASAGNTNINKTSANVDPVSTSPAEYKMPRIVESFSCRRESIHLVSTSYRQSVGFEEYPHNLQNLSQKSDRMAELEPIREKTSFNLSTRHTAADDVDVVHPNASPLVDEHVGDLVGDSTISVCSKKKQVKFNSKPIGPTRTTASDKQPMKPAIKFRKQRNRKSVSPSSPNFRSTKQMARREQIQAVAEIFRRYDILERDNTDTTKSSSDSVTRKSANVSQLSSNLSQSSDSSVTFFKKDLKKLRQTKKKLQHNCEVAFEPFRNVEELQKDKISYINNLLEQQREAIRLKQVSKKNSKHLESSKKQKILHPKSSKKNQDSIADEIVQEERKGLVEKLKTLGKQVHHGQQRKVQIEKQNEELQHKKVTLVRQLATLKEGGETASIKALQQKSSKVINADKSLLLQPSMKKAEFVGPNVSSPSTGSSIKALQQKSSKVINADKSLLIQPSMKKAELVGPNVTSPSTGSSIKALQQKSSKVINADKSLLIQPSMKKPELVRPNVTSPSTGTLVQDKLHVPIKSKQKRGRPRVKAKKATCHTDDRQQDQQQPQQQQQQLKEISPNELDATVRDQPLKSLPFAIKPCKIVLKDVKKLSELKPVVTEPQICKFDSPYTRMFSEKEELNIAAVLQVPDKEQNVDIAENEKCLKTSKQTKRTNCQNTEKRNEVAIEEPFIAPKRIVPLLEPTNTRTDNLSFSDIENPSEDLSYKHETHERNDSVTLSKELIRIPKIVHDRSLKASDSEFECEKNRPETASIATMPNKKIESKNKLNISDNSTKTQTVTIEKSLPTSTPITTDEVLPSRKKIYRKTIQNYRNKTKTNHTDNKPQTIAPRTAAAATSLTLLADTAATTAPVLNFETTPTVPVYLFNGESCEIPTPMLVYGGVQPFINSSLPAKPIILSNTLIQTSDHEVSSTQESVNESPKRLCETQQQRLTDATSLLVQNNQVDTTHHLPHHRHNPRISRKHSFHDDIPLTETVAFKSQPLKKRRQTVCAETAFTAHYNNRKLSDTCIDTSPFITPFAFENQTDILEVKRQTRSTTYWCPA